MAETTSAYQWVGINKQGKRVQGTLQVSESKDVPGELAKIGVEVISFKAKRKAAFSFGKPPVKTKNILLFTRYLSTLLAAGLPMLQALDVISNDQDNEAMHDFVVALKNNISGGKTLAESFAEYPQYFSDLYINLIKAGEKSGTLDKILNRLGTYLERTESLKSKARKALIYPTAIVIVATVVSSIMLIFVVPKFKTLFDSFDAQLPFFTRVVIAISNFMQSYWLVILGMGILAFYGIKYFIRHNEKFQFWMHGLILKIPVIGIILRKVIIARFTRTLSTTLESGMPITEAMHSMIEIMGNVVYSQAIIRISNDVVSGHQLYVAMNDTKLFPNMVIQMVSVGEISGNLAGMLHKVADYYEEEVSFAVENMSSLLEPLIMVILGVVIGGLVIAMYLPIFKLGTLF